MAVKIRLGSEDRWVEGVSVKRKSKDRLELEKQLSPLAEAVMSATDPLEIYEVYDEDNRVLGYYMSGALEVDEPISAKDINSILEGVGTYDELEEVDACDLCAN